VIVKAAENKLDDKGAEYFEKISLQIEVNGKPYSSMIGSVVGGIGMALMEEV
jgi:hypothetical protein